MNRYKETFDTWNKVAALYQDKFMDLDLYDKTYDFICNSIIKNKAEILEIGCGPGNITKYLLSRRPDFNIFGLDIAPNMIELAKKNNPASNFDVMDIRKIGDLTRKFDGIVCGFCLPYLSYTDCERLISHTKKLLNENGILYISFVEGEPNKSGYKIGSSGDSVYFYYHSLDKLKAVLNTNLFEELKIFKVEYQKNKIDKETHTILIANRKPTI